MGCLSLSFDLYLAIKTYNMLYAIIAIVAFVAMVLILRMIGAWMLRINDLIDAQKKTNQILSEIRDNLKN